MTCPRCEGTDWKDGPGGSRQCAGCGWLMWTSGVKTTSTPLTEDGIRATISESRDVAVGSNVPPPPATTPPDTPTTMAGDEPILLPIVLPEISGPSEPVPPEVRELAAEIESAVLYDKPKLRRRRPRSPLSREQRSTLAALRNVHRRHETAAAERARLVGEARERGCTWKQIADACGVTHPTAIRWSRNAGT